MNTYEGTLFVPVIILLLGLAVGYILGERSGRREEAERMAAVQAILVPKAGWQGEQTLRDFTSGETPPLPINEKDDQP